MPSGTDQGALSGAASGAAAGAPLGPWGIAGGAVIGGISGALGGSADDRQRAANRAAQERLAAALSRYGAQGTNLSNATVQGAHSADDAYRAALQAHVMGGPDQAAMLPGRIATEQTALEGAGAPAMAPMHARGAGQNAYLANVAADTQRRFHDTANPLAFQGGAARAGMADADYQRQLATQLGGIGSQVRDLSTLQQLQQALNYEDFARAQAGYDRSRAQASTAGSDQALASGLIQAGGAGLAGMFMGRQGGVPNLFPGGSTSEAARAAQMQNRAMF